METSNAHAGLLAINEACVAIYPEQTNPLQVTALVKYWLGGPDPLDYISMYTNHGDTDTPLHWHYITYGLSDLYGDGRVHDKAADGDNSGFGFELTFRLLRDPCETSPPTWPAHLLQSIARYVYSSDNVLCSGDHISWHCPLDGEESIIKHLLLTVDHQLAAIQTPFGHVSFIQLVGVTEEELTAAQRWNCMGVLSLLRKHDTTGGQWLLTNMRRGQSLFDIDHSAQERVEKGISLEGSVLSVVNAVCLWDGQSSVGVVNPLDYRCPTSEMELVTTTVLENVNISLNKEAVVLLPLAIRGRLKHGRHFTYKSIKGDLAITLVANGVDGAFTGQDIPLCARGPWLQVYISDEHMDILEKGVEGLLAGINKPKTLDLCELHLSISILPND